jgi:hypothetical protein
LWAQDYIQSILSGSDAKVKEKRKTRRRSTLLKKGGCPKRQGRRKILQICGGCIQLNPHIFA